MQSLSTAEKLRYLYLATTALCLYMIVWILVLPASGLQDWVSMLDSVREKVMLARHVPPGLISKFKGHYAVHLTHTFPAALWSALIPFQLNPGFRNRNPRLHRIMGYTFMATSSIMMVGVAIIFQRGLLFVKFLEEVPHDPFYTSEIYLTCLSIWFLWTAGMATMEARRRRFASHQYWILRHIASGMWIAVMRVLLTCIGPFFMPPFYSGTVSQVVQGRLFSSGAFVGLVITVLASEYAIRLLKEDQLKKRP